MQPIILLHGAVGAADQLAPLRAALADTCEVHSFSFAGHGGQALPEGGLSIDLFAQELHDYITAYHLEGVPVFGYSMGGYVALHLCKKHPGLISKVVTLATKFHWDPQTAEKECRMLDPEKLAAKVPAFAKALSDRHTPEYWKGLLEATAGMLRDMGVDNPLKPEDYPGLDLPVLLLLGDRDKMVSLEETRSVYQALPNASMGMLPGTPHPLEQVDVQLLSFLIQRFLSA